MRILASLKSNNATMCVFEVHTLHTPETATKLFEKNHPEWSSFAVWENGCVIWVRGEDQHTVNIVATIQDTFNRQQPVRY